MLVLPNNYFTEFKMFKTLTKLIQYTHTQSNTYFYYNSLFIFLKIQQFTIITIYLIMSRKTPLHASVCARAGERATLRARKERRGNA